VQFHVKAHDHDGGIRLFEVDAHDEVDARRQVQVPGRQIISIVRAWRPSLRGAPRIGLVSFSQELIALLDAGLTLVESIETLTEKEPAAGPRRTLEQIRARLFEGRTLSSALEEQPQSFPPLYIATVRASERTGAIREALTRYVTYQQQIDLLRKKLVNASIYPLVLCGAGLLVTVFLLGYVVPRFSAIYQDIGSDLPWASKMLMEWGRAIQEHGFAVLLALAALAAVLARILGRGTSRAALGQWLARLPIVGRQLHLYQLARLYRTVGMLLRVHVKRVLQSENGLASFECRIDDEIGQIASANLSVFQPAEDALPDQGTA